MILNTTIDNAKEQLNSCIVEYRDSLVSIAAGMIYDRENAKDIVQEVCLWVLENPDQFKGASSPKTYLYRIVINRCIDHIRKGKRTIALFDILLREKSKESRPDYIEVKDLMNRLFVNIPGEFKAPLLLAEIDGMSYADIANTLNISLNTVKTRIYRCRERLQKELSKLEISKC
jgi:RNA polymerase sigma-70 factor, ECF subfamily